MESARAELEEAINSTDFKVGTVQFANVTTKAYVTEKDKGINKQLTASVLWTQNMYQMIAMELLL